MDQQLAVDAPVALPREPPYPLAALAAVRPLRATRSVSRAGAVPGHGHPHRPAHRVTWSWARGGPVTLPPQAPRAPIPGDPQRTTVRVTAALAGRAQERQPWVPPGGAAQAEGSVRRTLPGVLTGHTAELLESTVPLVLFSVFLKILNGRSWFFVVLDTPKRMLGTLAAECVTGNVQNPDRTGLTGQSHLLPRGTSRAHVHPRFPARLSRAVTHLHVLILLRNFYQLPVERASNCSRRTERPRLCQEPALSSAEETGQCTARARVWPANGPMCRPSQDRLLRARTSRSQPLTRVGTGGSGCPCPVLASP